MSKRTWAKEAMEKHYKEEQRNKSVGRYNTKTSRNANNNKTMPTAMDSLLSNNAYLSPDERRSQKANMLSNFRRNVMDLGSTFGSGAQHQDLLKKSFKLEQSPGSGEKKLKNGN